jgi:hypothetical protein
MPNPVHVTKAADLKMSGGQTDGMIRKVWSPSTKNWFQPLPVKIPSHTNPSILSHRAQ